MGASTLGLIFRIAMNTSTAEVGLARLQAVGVTAVGTLNRQFQSTVGITGTLRTVFTGLTAAIGVSAAAIFGAAEAWARYAEHIGNAARQTGFTTKMMSDMYVAAQLVGISTQAVDTAMTQFARNLGNLQMSTGSLAKKSLKDLGIAIEDTKKPMDVFFLEWLDKWSKLPDGPRKTADAMDVMRRSSAGNASQLIPWLNLMAKGFQAVKDEAHKLGLEISDEQVIKARNFLTAQRQLELQFKTFVFQLGQAVIPMLIKFATIVETITDRVKLARIQMELWARDHQILQTIFDLGNIGMGTLLYLLARTKGSTAELEHEELKLSAAIIYATNQFNELNAAVVAALTAQDKMGDMVNSIKDATLDYTAKLRDQVAMEHEHLQMLQDGMLPALIRIQMQRDRSITQMGEELKHTELLYKQNKLSSEGAIRDAKEEIKQLEIKAKRTTEEEAQLAKTRESLKELQKEAKGGYSALLQARELYDDYVHDANEAAKIETQNLIATETAKTESKLAAEKEELQGLQDGLLPAITRINVQRERAIRATDLEIANLMQQGPLYEQAVKNLQEYEKALRQVYDIEAKNAEVKVEDTYQKTIQETITWLQKKTVAEETNKAQEIADAINLQVQHTELLALQAHDYKTLVQIQQAAMKAIAAGEDKYITDSLKKAATEFQRMDKTIEHMQTPLSRHITGLRQSWAEINRINQENLHQIQILKDLQAEKEAQHASSTVLGNLNMQITKMETMALHEKREAEISAAGAAISGAAGVFAGKRAQAGVEAVFDTGMAIYEFAKYINAATEGDPQAAGYLMSSIQYTLAAAEMGKIAGTSGGKGGAGGGGGSRGGIRGKSGGEDQYGRSSGNRQGTYGAQGSQHLTIYDMRGSNILNPNELIRILAPFQNKMVTGGQITVLSTNALNNGPKQTGH